MTYKPTKTDRFYLYYWTNQQIYSWVLYLKINDKKQNIFLILIKLNDMTNDYAFYKGYII